MGHFTEFRLASLRAFRRSSRGTITGTISNRIDYSRIVIICIFMSR